MTGPLGETTLDFPSMRAHAKKKGLGLKEALMDYFSQLGEKQGYSVVRDTTVIKHGVDYGKIDLAWVEPDSVFLAEFGLPQDLFRHLFKVMVLEPAWGVLLLSSNSRCHPKYALDIVGATPQLSKTKYVLVDVTTGVTRNLLPLTEEEPEEPQDQPAEQAPPESSQPEPRDEHVSPPQPDHEEKKAS